MKRALLGSFLAVAMTTCGPKSDGSDGDPGDGGSADDGDVGAACAHSGAQAQPGPVVTTSDPACESSICIYANEHEPPDLAYCTPGSNDCTDAGASPDQFECVEAEPGGECRLRQDYFLAHSMCSMLCETDDECDVAVTADTACELGFMCARVAGTGPICCERTCVCKDDLGVTTVLDLQCQQGTQPGCCDLDPVPEACGEY
jgi:hypothetical protein